MKKRIVLFLIIFVFLLLPSNTWASSKITLVNTINNISNPTDLKITYLVMPATENEDGAVGEITELEVDFSDLDVIDYSIKKEVDLDFSAVQYEKAGVYRYVIRQKKMSDVESFVKSGQIYFVYVNVTINPDGSKNIDVSDLVYDTTSQEKTSLTFENEVKYTFFEVENRVEGMLKEQDRDVYFKYRIQINGMANSKYQIIGQDPFVYYHGEFVKTDNYYIINNKEEENYMYVYLKDKQKITIGKLVEGANNIEDNTNSDNDDIQNVNNNDVDNNSYINQNEEIVENNDLVEFSFNQIPIATEFSIKKIDDEKWLTIMGGEEIDHKTIKAKEKDNYVLIINRRDYDTAITGVIYTTLPYMIIIIITVLLFMISKKYRVMEEEL